MMICDWIFGLSLRGAASTSARGSLECMRELLPLVQVPFPHLESDKWVNEDNHLDLLTLSAWIKGLFQPVGTQFVGGRKGSIDRMSVRAYFVLLTPTSYLLPSSECSLKLLRYTGV